MRQLQKTYYQVLGVAHDASTQTIQQARKKLALKWHPDLCASKDPALSQKKMAEINSAYEVLSDPRRRAVYDDSLQEASDQAPTFFDSSNVGKHHPPRSEISSQDVVNWISKRSDPEAIIVIAREYGHLLNQYDFYKVFSKIPDTYKEEFFDSFHMTIINTDFYSRCLEMLNEESRAKLLLKHHKSLRAFDLQCLAAIKLLPKEDALSFLHENLNTIPINEITHALELYAFIYQSSLNDNENSKRHHKKLLDIISSKVINMSVLELESAIHTILYSDENLFPSAPEKNSLVAQLNSLRDILEELVHFYIPGCPSEKIHALDKIKGCQNIAKNTQILVNELIQDTSYKNRKKNFQEYENNCSRPGIPESSVLISNLVLASIIASLAIFTYFLIGTPLLVLISFPMLMYYYLGPSREWADPIQKLIPDLISHLGVDMPRELFKKILELLGEDVSVKRAKRNPSDEDLKMSYIHQRSPSNHYVPNGLSNIISQVKKAALGVARSKILITDEEKAKLRALQHFIFHHAWQTHPRGGMGVEFVDRRENIIVPKITVPHHIASILEAIKNCQNKKVSYEKTVGSIDKIVSAAKKRQRYSFFRSSDTKEQLMKLSENGIQKFMEDLPRISSRDPSR